jgi:hypothetical protein
MKVTTMTAFLQRLLDLVLARDGVLGEVAPETQFFPVSMMDHTRDPMALVQFQPSDPMSSSLIPQSPRNQPTETPITAKTTAEARKPKMNLRKTRNPRL